MLTKCLLKNFRTKTYIFTIENPFHSKINKHEKTNKKNLNENLFLFYY